MNNRYLSPELNLAFPDIVPSLRTVRPLVDNFEIPSASWLAGFTDAEGCYMVKIPASKTHSLGFKVYLEFNLTQHQRDEQLIKKFIDYFSCGRV